MGEDCKGERAGQKKTCWNLGGNLKKTQKNGVADEVIEKVDLLLPTSQGEAWFSTAIGPGLMCFQYISEKNDVTSVNGAV